GRQRVGGARSAPARRTIVSETLLSDRETTCGRRREQHDEHMTHPDEASERPRGDAPGGRPRSMRRVNLGRPDFHYDDDDPDGYRSGMFRFGRALGAQQTGASLYELPAGQALCPFHYEFGEAEWLLV